MVRVYPIGMITMTDNNRLDEKIIAIPFNDPTYNQFTDISELPAHIFEEMRHFFTVYKELEGMKHTAVDEIKGREDAIKTIEKSLQMYNDMFRKGR